MHAVIQDLEALKELNDELEENHVENEKQMQEEIGAQRRCVLRAALADCPDVTRSERLHDSRIENQSGVARRCHARL
jgi:dynactin 1